METPSKKLYRSRSNRMLFGVCAGLGDYFSIDVTVVRLLFVRGLLLGFGTLGLVYLVMMFVVPEEPVAGA